MITNRLIKNIKLFSGRKNGAAAIIERLLCRDLLWLPCRHHILELCLSVAHTTLFGKSSGPEVVLYKTFKQKWDMIDKSKYQTPVKYHSSFSRQRRQEIIRFTKRRIVVRIQSDLIIDITKQ